MSTVLYHYYLPLSDRVQRFLMTRRKCEKFITMTPTGNKLEKLTIIPLSLSLSLSLSLTFKISGICLLSVAPLRLWNICSTISCLLLRQAPMEDNPFSKSRSESSSSTLAGFFCHKKVHHLLYSLKNTHIIHQTRPYSLLNTQKGEKYHYQKPVKCQVSISARLYVWNIMYIPIIGVANKKWFSILQIWCERHGIKGSNLKQRYPAGIQIDHLCISLSKCIWK